MNNDQKRPLKSPAGNHNNQRFHGAKSQDGPLQLILNHIPPHDTFVEMCAGSGAISWNKKPARDTILIEKSEEQYKRLRDAFKDKAIVINIDALLYWNHCQGACKKWLFYWDPPYMFETRGGDRGLYDHEWSDQDHESFLQTIENTDKMCLLNHPECNLYGEAIGHWNRLSYQYMTRRGLRNDCIWWNYQLTGELHEYTYVGKDRTDRQRINRQCDNLLRRISALPAVQQNKLFEMLKNHFPGL